MPFFVYILRTSSNTLYIGQTNNLEKRIKEHKSKTSKSAKYMRYFKTFELVYSENYKTRTEAMQREIQLKKLTKEKKEALVNRVAKSSLDGNLLFKNLMTNKCSQCGLCCQLFLINLDKKEYQSEKYETQLEKFGFIDNFKKASACGVNILKQKRDGSCIYLKKNKCSIHKIRPKVCREFFCGSNLKKFKNMIEQIKKKRADQQETQL